MEERAHIYRTMKIFEVNTNKERFDVPNDQNMLECLKQRPPELTTASLIRFKACPLSDDHSVVILDPEHPSQRRHILPAMSPDSMLYEDEGLRNLRFTLRTEHRPLVTNGIEARQELKLRPCHSPALIYLGWCDLCSARDPSDAIEYLERAADTCWSK